MKHQTQEQTVINQLKQYGYVSSIDLGNGYSAVIDSIDFPLVSKKRWRASVPRKGKYIYAECIIRKGSKLKHAYLHRFLLGVEDRFKYVDHINHDTLDNRRCNLRIVTPAQNSWNRLNVQKVNKLPKGVDYQWQVKGERKWRSRIMKNGKRKLIGYFDTPESASKAYIKESKIMHGEYALV